MAQSDGGGMSNPVRRVVTGHDDGGKAIIIADGAAPNVRPRPGGIVSTLLWATDETPADISGRADRAERTIGIPPPPHGSIFRIVDFPPVGADVAEIDHAALIGAMGATLHNPDGRPARHPFMHRTRSVDYAVIIAGEIDMLLDDSQVHLRTGDVVVQQGTNHAWVNNGNETCRIAFILIDAREPETVLKSSRGG
jgi:mannose-6-phosphate isomerase-like protein (cupin superfamily)